MRLTGMRSFACALSLALTSTVWGQSQQPQDKPQQGPGKEIGSGAGNIGTGAAKGAGNAAKGAAKGAGDLVTLHPVKAGEAVGKGAVAAGKDVTVDTAKGSAKVVHGIGRALKRLF